MLDQNIHRHIEAGWRLHRFLRTGQLANVLQLSSHSLNACRHLNSTPCLACFTMRGPTLTRHAAGHSSFTATRLRRERFQGCVCLWWERLYYLHPRIYRFFCDPEIVIFQGLPTNGSMDPIHVSGNFNPNTKVFMVNLPMVIVVGKSP